MNCRFEWIKWLLSCEAGQMRLCIELVINLIPKGPHSVWHKYCIHWRMARPCRAHNLFLTCRRDKTWIVFQPGCAPIFRFWEPKQEDCESAIFYFYTSSSFERTKWNRIVSSWVKKKEDKTLLYISRCICVCVCFGFACKRHDRRTPHKTRSIVVLLFSFFVCPR